MQLKGSLLRPVSCKKSQDTKTVQLHAPKPILDDVDPNNNTVKMFLSSSPTQPKENLGISDILGTYVAISYVQTNVEK
jgi:hypothetical protein